MLKKQYHLPASQKFKNASSYKTQNFILKVSSNNLPTSRFGFIVKKALDKRATVRNRAKRVFRSCIEELLTAIKDGYDMLFFLEKGIIGKDRKIVFDEIQNLLKEKKLLRNN